MTKLFGYTNYWAVSGWVGLIFILFIFWPDTASAQTVFKSIVDIPGITGEPGATENFGIYINALYVFAITVGAMLAVLKLVAAGVKYMFSDIVTNKESAKNDIKGAILGLLIVIGAVVILNTVNTDLTEVDLNLSDASVDANDYFGDALRRIRSLIDSCTEEVGCIIVRGGSQEDCEEDGGRFINGNLFNGLSGWGGGAYFNMCLIQLEGNERDRIICEAEGRVWDYSNEVCLDSTEEMRDIDCEYKTRVNCDVDRENFWCTNIRDGRPVNLYDCSDSINICREGDADNPPGRTSEPPTNPNAEPGERNYTNSSQISCITTVE